MSIEQALLDHDAVGLADLVKRGEVSPPELVDAAIGRAERFGHLNAIIHPLYDMAREMARKAEPESPFAGLPFLVKDLEIESFIQLAGNKVKNMTALTLAIAGNALKAFPGLGTISGGVVHAVAYGMIFDSLGRAAAETMASRGELRPYPAAEAFEDLLHEHLESGAVRFAKLAVSSRDSSDDRA